MKKAKKTKTKKKTTTTTTKFFKYYEKPFLLVIYGSFCQFFWQKMNFLEKLGSPSF